MSSDGHIRGLPGQVTSIIGRSREVDAISALIRRDDVRLVTLTGPGGIGKTRLAIAVAEAIASDFLDGVVFVSLAAIRDPSLLLPTIVQELGVRERAGFSAREGLIAAIGESRRLLVLDNMEQLRTAAPEISWLLASCPNLEVMITSRGRLQLRGEHEYAVPSLLPVPSPHEETSTTDRNPAAELFLQRATEVQPDLAMTEGNRQAIAEICRRLDGLPLAIELAAARSRVLPPSALLSRLDRRLPLLTGGARDLPDRQRTMRDAIAWSYDLLTPDEQLLFRCLCVFSGGFTLLEAEALLPDQELLDGLEQLVNNGLLLQPGVEGEPRFQLLETLREFGLEQLDLHGLTQTLRDRHADFFTEFAEAALTRLRGAERTSWLERLEVAHDNLRAALTWLTEIGGTTRAVRLAGSLWQFWWWRSHLGEGRNRLEAAIALPGTDACGAWYARALTGIGALAETQGAYEDAESYHERAVAAWEALDDTRGLATSLLFRWLVAFNADDQTRMAALSAESIRLFRELGDPWGIAMSQMEQGVMAMRIRDHAGAERVLSEGIAGFGAIGDAWGVAICQGVAGNVATDRGDFVTAADELRASLTTLLLLDDLWGVATIMPASARMAAEQGAFEQSVKISGAIMRMHRTMGAPLKVPFRERYERNLEAAKGLLGEQKFNRALAAGEAMTPAEAVKFAIEPIATAPPASPVGIDSLAIPLSPREREVLRLYPGRTGKQIGQALFISESTVRTHVENIFNKLGVRNQKELVAYIYEHNLI